jgi:dTDP-4-dehydrorhamnose reductase
LCRSRPRNIRAPAARPRNSRLACARLKERFGVALSPWEDGLSLCLEEMRELDAA